MMKQDNHVFTKEISLGLKGVAILMMLMHHSFLTADRFAGFSVQFSPFTEQTVIKIAILCKICVSIFAFITGYGLYLSYENCNGATQKWAVKRYISTFSGYQFVWIASSIILEIKYRRLSTLWFWGDKFTGLIYATINFLGLSNLFATSSLDYRWWYMSAVIVFILLMPIVYKLRNELGLVLIFEILFIRMLFVRYDNALTTGGQAVYTFLTPFLLGSITARYSLVDKWVALGKGKIYIKLYKFIAELWIIIFLCKMYLNTSREQFWDLHYGLFPLIIIMFLIEFFLQIPVLKEGLTFIGKHSANMFYVHSFVMYYHPDFIYRNKHFVVTILILATASLLISIVIEFAKRFLRYNMLIKNIQNRIG